MLPQVLSNFASYALLRFEINVRGAAVIGFVGAGGIGQELIVAIRKFYYSDVSAMLLMMLVCVMAIDFGSEKLRHRLLAPGGRAVSGTSCGPTCWPSAPAIEARYRDRAGAPAAAAGRRAGRSPRGARALCAPASSCSTSTRCASGRAWASSAPSSCLMLPPSAGGHFALYLDALGQTLSIAFLGTLLAASSPCRSASSPRATSWPTG